MTQTRPDCFKCCLPADHSTCCFFEVGDFSKVFPALPHLEGGRGLCYPTSTSSKGNDTPTGGSCSEEQFAPEVCNRSQDSQTVRCFRGTWWQEPRRVATTTLAALRPAVTQQLVMFPRRYISEALRHRPHFAHGYVLLGSHMGVKLYSYIRYVSRVTPASTCKNLKKEIY